MMNRREKRKCAYCGKVAMLWVDYYEKKDGTLGKTYYHKECPFKVL